MIRRLPSQNSGSVLVLALGWIAVLASIAVSTLLVIQSKYRQAFQTASWQDALVAAESGVDMAVNELR